MDKTGKQLGVAAGRNTLLSFHGFLQKFDEDETDGVWLFSKLVYSLASPANQTMPDISNAVRAVARNVHAPKNKHWKTARGVSDNLNAMSS